MDKDPEASCEDGFLFGDITESLLLESGFTVAIWLVEVLELSFLFSGAVWY